MDTLLKRMFDQALVLDEGDEIVFRCNNNPKAVDSIRVQLLRERKKYSVFDPSISLRMSIRAEVRDGFPAVVVYMGKASIPYIVKKDGTKIPFVMDTMPTEDISKNDTSLSEENKEE
jgi:hypothetical protein